MPVQEEAAAQVCRNQKEEHGTSRQCPVDNAHHRSTSFNCRCPAWQWIVPIPHSASDTLRASLDFGPEVRRRVRAHLEAEGADLPSTHLSHKKQPRRAKSAARSRTPTPTQGSKLQHGDGGRVSTPVDLQRTTLPYLDIPIRPTFITC